MKKIAGIFCYALGGLGLLSSFMNLAKFLGPESGGDTNPARILGYMLGLFLVPIVLLWLGYALWKDDPQT